MTREKKIKQNLYIQSLIYLFIIQRGCFDWWLEPDFFEQVAKTAQCSVHKVKRVFYKKILIEDYTWLMNFTY